jgi:ABC-2 type transport system ATP-binding protein
LLAELAQTADDVVIIDQGQLVAAGPMAELLERSQASSLEDLFLAVTSPDAQSTHPASTRSRSLS